MSWGKRIANVLNQAKDAGASMAIEKWLARELAEYGELTALDINSREKKLELTILLKGETDPVQLHVDRYELVDHQGRASLRVQEVRASRPWLQSLFRNFLVGAAIPIPAQYAKYAPLVL
jgi:hypothetical protein